MLLADLTTIDDFIAFYEAIPEEDWCCNNYQDACGRRCALGHLDTTSTKTSEAVFRLFSIVVVRAHYTVADINDGHDPKYQQPSPKARILAFLNDCKLGKTDW